jgi:two-component system response regulator
MMMAEDSIILLAEDNSDDIELIKRMFEKNRIGNKLIVIQDGEEVLDYLFRQGSYEGRQYSLPSLILLSLNMPKLGGVEILEKIRQNGQASSIPVLVLIAHETEKKLIEDAGLEVEGYIQKPLSLETLEIAVEKLGFSLLREPGSEEGP